MRRLSFQEDDIGDIKAQYSNAQDRYVQYYLNRARASSQLSPKAVRDDLPNLQHAFQLVTSSGDNQLASEFWDALSASLWNYGFWDVYGEWVSATLRLSEVEDRDSLARAWRISELGWLVMEKANYALADSLFRSASEVFHKEQDLKGICTIERYLGVLAYRTKDYERAAIQYALAERIAEENSYLLSLSEIWNLQGSLERKLKHYDLARSKYEAAATLCETEGDLSRATAVYRNLAQLAVAQGDTNAARTAFERTISLCQSVNRVDMLHSCELKLASLEQSVGNVERALALALKAREGFIQLGLSDSVQQANDLLARLQRPPI